MPCVSDYLNPTERERLLQRTAKLYAYTLTQLGSGVPNKVAEALGLKTAPLV